MAFSMVKRRHWSVQEDKMLKQLKEQQGETKWSVISTRIKEKILDSNKTGKQCRDRYLNYICQSFNFSGWSAQEDAALYSLHNDNGNKWALIAKLLTGRSQNAVKNRFYCLVRKAYRHMVKKTEHLFENENPLTTPCLLSRVLKLAEENFDENSRVSDKLVASCRDIKNNLLAFSCSSRICFSKSGEITFLFELVKTICAVKDSCLKARLPKKIYNPDRLSPPKNTVADLKTSYEINDKNNDFVNNFYHVSQEILLADIQ